MRWLVRKFLQYPGICAMLGVLALIVVINMFVYLIQNTVLGPLLLLLLVVGRIIGLKRVEQALESSRREKVRLAEERAENERLAQLETLDRLRLLTPTQFEETVVIVLRRLGYRQVERVGGSGDLCADIKAIGLQGEEVVVQCKRYAASNRVGSQDVQTFIGMINVEHRADKGMYVTTSAYTKAARDLGLRHGIELIEGEELVKMIHTVAVQW